ncbi:MAG TPA: hypothetical protein ENK57_24300 [Polyangiaceae bacterium]|nr:hypothetical protein [Polyangiaceae bacterium]
MRNALRGAVVAALLGAVTLTATMWTTASPVTPESEIYADRAQVGLVEQAAWLAELEVAEMKALANTRCES